jgi:hypothetical protein
MLTVAPSGAMSASGIVVTYDSSGTPSGGSPLQIGVPVVHTEGQGTYRLDGGLVDTVVPPAWHFVGMDGLFSIFVNSQAAGRAEVEGGGPGATARVVSSTPWGTETIRVTTARPAVLVRAEAYDTGWRATIESDGPEGHPAGNGRATPVLRDGIVQAVHVPAGVHLVTFRYRPTRVFEGLGLSAAGVLIAFTLMVWPAGVVRFRGRGRRR